MIDKITFMETVHSVQEIVRTSGAPMSRIEVMSYFKDMELSQEQEEMVYQFLQLPPEALEKDAEMPEEVLGKDDAQEKESAPNDRETEGVSSSKKGKNKNAAEEQLEAEEGMHFQMYLEEVNEIKGVTSEEEEQLYQQLLAGDTSVIEPICMQWLKRVTAIAEEYKGRGYLLDDLVQEGNMGLLLGLNDLAGRQQEEDISGQLAAAIRTTIEAYLGEESGENQQSETILAKVSLVHEAKKLLTQEKGIEPSMQELAEYTRIPEDEINDILSLLKDDKKAAC